MKLTVWEVMYIGLGIYFLTIFFLIRLFRFTKKCDEEIAEMKLDADLQKKGSKDEKK